MKEVKAFGFDQSAVRDMGILFLPEVAKTLTNGSSPGHHSGVVIALDGCWVIDDEAERTQGKLIVCKK